MCSTSVGHLVQTTAEDLQDFKVKTFNLRFLYLHNTVTES